MNKSFTIYCRHAGTQDPPWEEEYNRDVEDPEKWAAETIARFNATLRAFEKPRELVRVVIHGDANPREHKWSKTNVYSLEYQGRMYDAQKCETCGITGKRWTLGGTVLRDSKYRALVYAGCDTTIAHLKKKEKNKP